VLTLDDVKEAYPRVKEIAHRTPLVHSRTLSEMAGARIYLKLENLQRTGSFKVRGSANRLALLTPRQRERGVVAASAGNHAQAVAMAATRAGVKSTVVMPKNASLAKLEATIGYGAKVLLEGDDMPHAMSHARRLAKESGAEFIHPYDDRLVAAGQGTLGLEIAEQLGELDAVIVPVGGGGLISGVATAVKGLKPDVKVYGVQPENCHIIQCKSGGFESCRRGAGATIADGLDVGVPSKDNLKIINDMVDDIVFVSEAEIASSLLLLLERAKTLAEGAGACPVAAALSGKLNLKGDSVVCLISGGNIDVNLLGAIMSRGLVQAGRYLSITTMIGDRPGELARLTGVIARSGANIYSVTHDRLAPGLNVEGTVVELDLETRGHLHSKDVVELLQKSGYDVNVR